MKAGALPAFVWPCLLFSSVCPERLQGLPASCRLVSSMPWDVLLSCAGIAHATQLSTLLLPSCRYPIVLESGAWTTNMKQKLSCGSVLLSNKLFFYDFFTRALKPGVHFVEVDSADICNDVVAQVGGQAGQLCTCKKHGLSWMATLVGAESLCHSLRHAAVGTLSIREPPCCAGPPHSVAACNLLCSALPSCLLCQASSTVQFKLAEGACMPVLIWQQAAQPSSFSV